MTKPSLSQVTNRCKYITPAISGASPDLRSLLRTGYTFTVRRFLQRSKLHIHCTRRNDEASSLNRIDA
ncbi:hypothetical protein BH23BAC4_BH23BAC4_07560 [soil metagenome]